MIDLTIIIIIIIMMILFRLLTSNYTIINTVIMGALISVTCTYIKLHIENINISKLFNILTIITILLTLILVILQYLDKIQPKDNKDK